ncbi:MAG: rod shape-determining protein MreC [Bacteroidota bacterium]|nr:rod shape-determining protein MreC [Bacteroidota bacterium]
MRNIFLFIRRYFTFLCFVALQVLCIVMLSRSSKTHEAFFTNSVNEVTGRVNQQYSNFSTYFSLKENNRLLAEENSHLRNLLKQDYAAPDSSFKTYIDSLQKDSSARTYRKFRFLPAYVVGNSISSQTNYIILERGSKQGVKKGMAVIGPNGIAGVVIDVSDNFSRAMSLLHRSSKVSAMLKKDNNFGSIEWDGTSPYYLTLKNISKGAKVAKGDTVVTSTYSANFPPGFVIGTVAAISSDASSNFYTLKIKTATDFFTLQYVDLVENTRYEEQMKLEAIKPKANE